MITLPYRILRFHRDWPCLLCLVCNRWSYHPTDVQQRYCGWCHLFLDELPEDYGRASTGVSGSESLVSGSRPETTDHTPETPPHPWERPAFPPPRQPWEKPVPPAIAACGMCDDHGMVDLDTPDGTRLAARCCHTAGAMQAFATHHGYHFVRENRSREPPPSGQVSGSGFVVPGSQPETRDHEPGTPKEEGGPAP